MHGIEAAEKEVIDLERRELGNSCHRNDTWSAFWRTNRYLLRNQGMEEGVSGSGDVVGKGEVVWKAWYARQYEESVPDSKVQAIRDRLRRKAWAGQKAKCLGGLTGCVGQGLRDLWECWDFSLVLQYINEFLFCLEFRSAHDFLVLYLNDLSLLFAVPLWIRRFLLHHPNTLWHDEA